MTQTRDDIRMEVRKVEKEQNIEKWSSMDTIKDYLDVSRETVLQWINNRGMPAHKVGRQWKFKISEVDEWVRKGKIKD